MHLRYLALGDSYSIGEGVTEAERWPNQLSAALVKEGVACRAPHVIAATGWTTQELSCAMDGAEPIGSWDLVSLLIGVNDQYRGGTPEAYRPCFRALLDRAILLAGGRPRRVFVPSIPDWSVAPFAAGRDRAAIGQTIDDFNAVAAQQCAACGVAFIDITAASREARAPGQFVADGLHPAAATHARWATVISQVARKLVV